MNFHSIKQHQDTLLEHVKETIEEKIDHNKELDIHQGYGIAFKLHGEDYRFNIYPNYEEMVGIVYKFDEPFRARLIAISQEEQKYQSIIDIIEQVIKILRGDEDMPNVDQPVYLQ